MPETAEKDSLTVKPKTRPSRKSANIQSISNRINAERETNEWTESIACARDIAMAFLPRKRTDLKVVKKSVVFGPDCEVHVKYSVPDDCEMPFGSDRFVFFGIQHLARQSGSPLVRFEKAGQLLDMFGLPAGGTEYRRLRDRFMRLRSLNIEIETRRPGGSSSESTWGIGSRFIEEWALPSKRDADAERAGQGMLQLSESYSPYYVQLSDSLFRRVQSGSAKENILLLRLDLLQHFRDCPIGWDFCVFLLHRCGSARKLSRVPHSVLMQFFKAGKEKDHQTAARLRRYFGQIMEATNNTLNVRLQSEDVRMGPGRPRRQWHLEVGPSPGVIYGSKRKRRSLPAGAEEG